MLLMLLMLLHHMLHNLVLNGQLDGNGYRSGIQINGSCRSGNWKTRHAVGLIKHDGVWMQTGFSHIVRMILQRVGTARIKCFRRVQSLSGQWTVRAVLVEELAFSAVSAFRCTICWSVIIGVAPDKDERRCPIGICVVIGGGIIPESISCFVSTTLAPAAAAAATATALFTLLVQAALLVAAVLVSMKLPVSTSTRGAYLIHRLWKSLGRLLGFRGGVGGQVIESTTKVLNKIKENNKNNSILYKI